MPTQSKITLSTLNLREAFPSYFQPLFDIKIAPQSNQQALALFLVIGTGAVLAFLVLIYIKWRKLLNEKYVILEIKPPYHTLQSAFSTTQLFSVVHALESQINFIDKLLGNKKAISCELVSSKESGIRYLLRVHKNDAPSIKKSINAYLSTIEIKEVEDYVPAYTQNSQIQEFKLSRQFVIPLQEQAVLDKYDPIAYITSHMTKLKPDEIVSLQIVCTPVLDHTHSSLMKQIRNLRVLIASNKDITGELNNRLFKILNSVFDLLFGNKKQKSINQLSLSKQHLHQSIDNKISEPLFESSIRLYVKSDNRIELQSRIKGIQSSFETFSTIHQSLKRKNHFILPKLSLFNKLKYLLFSKRLLSFFNNSILSLSELSSIYHLPYTQTTKTEDIQNVKSPKFPPPLSLKQEVINLNIVFANNIYNETVTPIGLTSEERRRHIYMIGATGTGKTTLLLQMIYQDILKGKGVAVIDPHGDLSERILGVIPEKRIHDVVYFNPYDIDYSIGLNVLEMQPNLTKSDLDREKDLITSSLISIFHKLYPARYSGPRMEHILRNTVLTALSQENSTLFTIYKLLTDTNYRKQVVANLNDPILKDFWKTEFEKLGSFQRAEQISPITNKLGRFLTTTITRNILNQTKSKLNFGNVMNGNKILICDLSKGKIGEDTSSFLGSLIIAKLQLSALNRVHTKEADRTDFFLYIDEFQNFATTAFAQILSEARKYRLNTILAHQTISQIEDKELLKVILANVGTVISFRTSNPSDEDFILPLFSPQVSKHEIANLPSYNFFIKINAISPQDTFSGESNNFEVPENKETTSKVIVTSCQNYGTKIEEQRENKETQIKEPAAEEPVKKVRKKKVTEEAIKRVPLM